MQYPSRFAFSAIFATLLVGACTDETFSRPNLEPPTVPVGGVNPGSDPAPEPEPSKCIPTDAGAAMYGTHDDDEFRDVVVTADGSIVIAGFENGRATSAGMRGSRGIALAYRNGFTRLAALDTQGTATFESLALDPADQRVWLAARTDVDVNDFPARGGFDYLMGELGATGFRALVRGQDSTPEYPKQLAVAGGKLAVVGHEERLVSDGSTWINPFIEAFDAVSAMPSHWYSTRRTGAAERYTAVDVAPKSILVGGNLADGAEPGMFVIARTHDADVLWKQRISNVGTDDIAAVRALPGGDVLWVGTTSATLGDAAYGANDIVIGRLDGTTGAALWTKQLGSDADEHAVDVALDGAGHIFIAGDMTATGLTERDVFLLALDETGEVVSRQEWASSGDDVPTAVAVDTCGTAVVVGHTTGDLAGNALGGRDGFVLLAPVAAPNPR